MLRAHLVLKARAGLQVRQDPKDLLVKQAQAVIQVHQGQAKEMVASGVCAKVTTEEAEVAEGTRAHHLRLVAGEVRAQAL